MVRIGVNARIKFVRDVVGVVADVGRSCRGTAMVQVGVKAGVELVGSVRAVRSVVGRCGLSRVQALAVSIDWRDPGTMAGTVVTVFNLVGSLGSNRCVLVNA